MNETIDSDPVETPYAQQGTVINPALQAILSSVDPSLGNGTFPSAQDLLSQLGSTNPSLELLAKYLLTQQAPTANEDSDAVESEIDEVRRQSNELAQAIIHLRRQLKESLRELNQLRERNDAFALALGACYICWGENPDCLVCGGTGRPGSTTPERQVFSRLVVPAIRALQVPKEVKRKNRKNAQRSD